MDIRPQRWGSVVYRIVLYPPGISAEERRRVRVWRGFYAWGTAWWLVVTAVLSGFAEPWFAVTVASVTTLLFGTRAFLRAGSVRSRVRTADVTVPLPNSDRALLALARQVQAVGTAMVRADRRLREGQITAAEHEVIWHRAYENLLPTKAIPAFGRYGGVR
ncbi:hypothetical protein TS71_00010 [Mycolicibacterium neoaurum]|uniref:Uncharacterized protein n=1 Tax=Mycolicibacterium neoaurum VKM Ac-1815D TaxID=700508 RepID=V5XI00_MYCNE|nr:hypothetical protein D174_21845 [Mycolicibacterium neoaurum VKM Ac-1815D]AMO07302.1 hypothetical protein MyAD_21425 [Mycolicibacterium neoaurum]AXK74314.1 hypothetical protein DXK33_03445 [Mycolicibacterium neoaurum]KJQ51260.1 hypothetical protein TS71_00010 [Mycolicibacterium neoaurum]